MKEIIAWLLYMEEASGAFYKDAAAAFPEDRELTELLAHLAIDEKEHHEIIKKSIEIIWQNFKKKN